MKNQFSLLLLAAYCFILSPQTIRAQEIIPFDSIYLSLFTENVYAEGAVFASDSMGGGEVLPLSQMTKAIILLKGEIAFERVDKLEIALGAAFGTSDLLLYEFELDNNYEMPEGLSFFRDNNLIILNLGRDTGPVHKYCRLRIKYMDGNYSTPVFFNN